MESRPIRDRAGVVCVECHSRKVKCDLQESPDGTCRHCRRAKIKCIRRDGVRKRRKLATPCGAPPPLSRGQPSPPPSFGSAAEVPSMAPLAQSAGQSAVTPRRQDGSFIADSSVMSFDPVIEPAIQEGYAPRVVCARDAILKATEADVLPPPALLQALKESFIEHILPIYPVLDPGELSRPDTSTLLLQAVCLAGCLMRHDEKSLQLGYTLYEKVKVLLHVDYEEDDVTVLKTMCILSCWSLSSPYTITLDGPWHWVGMAVRMAIQMGLQRQSTYANHSQAGCLRRIFWHLRNSEWLMAACWGRPPALRLEEYDVLPLIEHDFPSQGLPALFAVQMTKLAKTVGRIADLIMKKAAMPEHEIASIAGLLCDWQHGLPDELRPFDADGTPRPFHRHTSELFIHYFTSVILLQMLIKDAQMQWWTSAPSVAAASCVARLYDDINCREQASHLLHIHGFLSLVSAVVLISYSPESREKEVLRKRDIEIIYSTLKTMRIKFGGARVLLDKIQRIQHDVESSRAYPGAPVLNGGVPLVPGPVKLLEDRLDELFPLPLSFCENMDLLGLTQTSRTRVPTNEFVPVEGMSFGQSADTMFSIMDILDMNFDTFDASTMERMLDS